MSVTNLRISADNAIILSNLQLGGSQQSGRTDNVVAAKMRKLRWALETAEAEGGVVILSGRVFNKSNSFSDLSFLLNQGVLHSSNLYFMPDYPSYREKGELSHRSMLGVVHNIHPGKVVVTGAVLGSDSSEGIIYLSPWEAYTPEAITSDHSAEQHYVFDYQRKIKSRHDDTINRCYLSSYPMTPSMTDDGVYLGSAFRESPSSNIEPYALRLCVGQAPEFLGIPHEAHVFDEAIERNDRQRSQVQEKALLSISEEFDPRHKKVAESGGVIKAIDILYGKNKITKPAYDIIKMMIEKKPA